MDDEGEILMGCWDCRACGARRVRGDAYQCSRCGSPRPDDVEYYLPDDAEVVVDAVGVEAALAGPDWQCAFCDSWMPATDQACIHCKSSRADSERKQKTKVYENEADVPRTAPTSSPAAVPQPVASPAAAPRRMFSRGCLTTLAAAAAVVVLLVICGGVYGVIENQRYQAFQQQADRIRTRVKAAELRVAGVQAEYDEALQKVRRAEQAVVQAKQAISQNQLNVSLDQQAIQKLEQAAPVQIAAHRWTVKLDLEQVAAQDNQGWTHPPDAFDVKSEMREHHRVRVLDHVDTLYRTETYREQDGFDTETYTERVQAGTRRVQDGYTTKNLGNGRFQKTPKYRTETVYRNETRTRRTPRIVTKTRQIPYQQEVYRQDPVYQPWYTYRTKVWKAAPSLSRSGEGLQPLDPAEAPADEGIELGARRVSNRTIAFTLDLQPTDGEPMSLAVNENRWKQLADGAQLLLAHSRLWTAEERTAQIATHRESIAALESKAPELQQKFATLQKLVPPLQEKLPPLERSISALQSEVGAEQQTLNSFLSEGY